MAFEPVTKTTMPDVIWGIVKDSAAEFNVDPVHIVAKRSHKLGIRETYPLKLARASAVMRMRSRGASTPQIGVWLGGRHHATILYIMSLAEKEMATEAAQVSKPAISREQSVSSYGDSK